MLRLAWTFAARIGDKYQIRSTQPIQYANDHLRSNQCPKWLDEKLLSKPHETEHSYDISHTEYVDSGGARYEHNRQGYPEHVGENKVLDHI